MTYNMMPPGLYPIPRQKPRRAVRYTIYFLLSALLQLSCFYAIDSFLKDRGSLALEPTKVSEVQERKVVPSPSPDYPGLMAISADHTRLAIVDVDQLRIYNLQNGSQILYKDLGNYIPGALQWLPDRNRLIFALLSNTTVSSKPPRKTNNMGVADETYSNDTYRDSDPLISSTKEGFQVSLFSVDDKEGASPELIQSFNQSGQMPAGLNLDLSTYTNLLYVNWLQGSRDNLVQVDIMKRIKDIRLPRGQLNKLVVSSRTGSLWAEMKEDNTTEIYKYIKNSWKLQKHLDGYRLLGINSNEQLAVAIDINGQAKEVSLVDEKGDFKPGWAFSMPIELSKVSILKDGRLIYFDKERVIVHTPQLGEGTLFNMPRVDCYSADGKLVLSWQRDTGEFKIMEEVEKKK